MNRTCRVTIPAPSFRHPGTPGLRSHPSLASHPPGARGSSSCVPHAECGRPREREVPGRRIGPCGNQVSQVPPRKTSIQLRGWQDQGAPVRYGSRGTGLCSGAFWTLGVQCVPQKSLPVACSILHCPDPGRGGGADWILQ